MQFSVRPFTPIDLSSTKQKQKKKVDNQQNSPTTSKDKTKYTHQIRSIERQQRAHDIHVSFGQRLGNLQALKKASKLLFCLIKKRFFFPRRPREESRYFVFLRPGSWYRSIFFSTLDNGSIATVVVEPRLATNLIAIACSSIPVHSTTSSNLRCVCLYRVAEPHCSMTRAISYPCRHFLSPLEYFYSQNGRERGDCYTLTTIATAMKSSMYLCALNM